jgi:putative spermidine/putrescine transport system substrate-binding protein
MKRGFLFITFIAATSVGSAAVAEQLIVNSYGGPYEDIIRSRIIEPFEKEFNTKVIYDAVGSASQDYAKIKATRGRPGFDVVVMTASQSLDGCRDGLLEKFSLESVPNIAKLNPEISRIAGACGAVHEVQYLSLLWRKDKLPFAPASWSALFREELKGKVILPTFQNIMAAYLMQIMSVTNGGDLIDNVDPGFEAMGNLAKQSIGFEQSSSIMENWISWRSAIKAVATSIASALLAGCAGSGIPLLIRILKGRNLLSRLTTAASVSTRTSGAQFCAISTKGALIAQYQTRCLPTPSMVTSI